MVIFLRVLFEMMSRTRSITPASAVKMELSVGRAFLIIVLFRTAAQAVLSFPWSHP